MAGGIEWFRWHHGSATDPKFRLIAKKAGARTSEVLAMWACLLESASAAEERGNAGAPDFESLDLALDMEDGTASRIYARMCERDVIDAETSRVVAWEKRQPKRERPEDTSTDRVRAHRANKAQATPDNAKENTAEPCNAMERQETPRGEESREEKKREDKGTKRTARGTRLPDSFEPDFQFAVDQGLQNTLEEAHKFRDYWNAQPGQKGVKTDWPATWRNWCRNARPTARAGPSETAYQRSKRELYERAIGRNKKPIVEIFDEPLELQNEFAGSLD